MKINGKRVIAMIVTMLLLSGVIAGCAAQTPPTQTNGPTVEATQAPEPAKENPSLAEDYAKVKDGIGYFSIDGVKYTTPDPDLVIGCLVTENSPGFHNAIYEAVQEELKANNVQCLISVCENNVTTQVSQIENYIAQKVDGICLLPATPVDGINVVLEKAFEAGIPVMVMDVFPDDNAIYMAGVFTDAYTLAYDATTVVLNYYYKEHGTYEGQLGIIGGIEGNTVSDKRNQGMRDAIKDVTNGAMKEVSFIYCGGYTEEQGLVATENMLAANPEIDILLPTSEAIALGAIAALENVGLNDKIIMATIDGSKNALKIIKDGGPIKAIGINSPVVVAQGCARLLLAYLMDGTIPESKQQVLQPEVVTPDNIDQYYDPNAIF